MAVLAAVVASTVALVQYRHNKNQQRQDRWWQTLHWIIDRTFVEKDKDRALPQTVTISVLHALYETSGKTDFLQFLTIRGLHDLFRLPGEEGPNIDVEGPPRSGGSEKQRLGAASEWFTRAILGVRSEAYKRAVLAPSIDGESNAVLSTHFAVTDPEAIALLKGLRHKLESREALSLMTSATTYFEDVFATLERITRLTEFRVKQELEPDKAILLVYRKTCWPILTCYKRNQLTEAILTSARVEGTRTYRDRSTGKQIAATVRHGIVITPYSGKTLRSLPKSRYLIWRGPIDNDKLREMLGQLKTEAGLSEEL